MAAETAQSNPTDSSNPTISSIPCIPFAPSVRYFCPGIHWGPIPKIQLPTNLAIGAWSPEPLHLEGGRASLPQGSREIPFRNAQEMPPKVGFQWLEPFPWRQGKLVVLRDPGKLSPALQECPRDAPKSGISVLEPHTNLFVSHGTPAEGSLGSS